MNIFVYGALRRHEAHHSLLERCRVVAMQAWARGRLYDTRYGLPAFVPGGDHTVFGEVYEVNEADLVKIDNLKLNEQESSGKQSVERHYHRIVMPVETDAGMVEANIYIYSDDHVHDCDAVDFGDWRLSNNWKNQSEWLFFAYGSAMDNRRLQQAGVEDLFDDVIGTGVLTGYDLQYTVHRPDGGRADIVEVGGTVEGKVYRVGRDAMEYLFEREGVWNNLYRPALLDMMINGKMKQDIIAFLNIQKQLEVCPPKWYGEEILRGAQGWVSDGYYETLREKLEKLAEAEKSGE